MLHGILLVPSILAGLVIVFLAALAVHLVNRDEVRAANFAVTGIDRRPRLFEGTSLWGWLVAVVTGVVFWIIIYLGPTVLQVTFWAGAFHAVFFLLALGFILALVQYWRGIDYISSGTVYRVGGAYGFGEFLVFSLLAYAFTMCAASEGSMFARLFDSHFAETLFTSISWIFFVLAEGFFLVDMIYFYIRDRSGLIADPTERARRQRTARVGAWFLKVLCIIIALLILGLGVDWKELAPKDIKVTAPVVTPTPTPTTTLAPTPTSTPEPEPEEPEEFQLSRDSWYYLFHWDVMDDDVPENDDDFGTSPLDKILAEMIATGELTVKDIENKSARELYELVRGKVLEKFEEELRVDPVKGAACMGYYDVLHGTRFLGSFITELKDHKDALMEKINAKAWEWVQDQEAYLEVLEVFIANLEASDEIVITFVKSGLDDQMYMNGITVSGFPDVIVMESYNHSGWMLTFRDWIKGTTLVEVSYRIDCDFQPTNVAEVAPVTVRPNPREPEPSPTPTKKPDPPKVTPTPTPSPSPTPTASPSPTPTPEPTPTSTPVPPPPPPPPPSPTPPPTPSPTPTPTPVPPPFDKDPTRGTPDDGSDDPGPGSSTNNGVGAKESKDEQEENSLHDTLTEYWEKQKGLEEPQKKAGDDNEPTYIPPSPTPAKPEETPPPPPAVDNNADAGTGNGGADDPTPITSGATYTDPGDGGTGQFDEDPPGEEWDIGDG